MENAPLIRRVFHTWEGGGIPDGPHAVRTGEGLSVG